MMVLWLYMTLNIVLLLLRPLLLVMTPNLTTTKTRYHRAMTASGHRHRRLAGRVPPIPPSPGYQPYQLYDKVRNTTTVQKFWKVWTLSCLSNNLLATEGATLTLQIALDVPRKSGNLRPYNWIIYLPLLMDAILALSILERLILLRSNSQRIPYHLRLFQVVSTRMWPWRRPCSLLVMVVTDLCP